MQPQYTVSPNLKFNIMTKVQNPIIGRSRGSAGGMTFTKNYGKNVMRTKPFEVSNPKTAAQTTQRNFFAQLSRVLTAFSPEQLRTLFPSMPKGMSRRNALAMQIAKDFTIAESVKSIDFANIATLGNASTMDFGETTCTQAGTTISVGLDSSVKNNTAVNQLYFVCVLVNETLGAMAMPITNNKVETGTLSITAPDGWLATHAIHAIPLITDKAAAVSDFGSFIIKERPEKTGR